MKHRITNLIEQTLRNMQTTGKLDPSLKPKVHVEHTRDKLHGDLASNIALTLAKAVGRKPRDIAQSICDCMPTATDIIKTEIAGPWLYQLFCQSICPINQLSTVSCKQVSIMVPVQ